MNERWGKLFRRARLRIRAAWLAAVAQDRGAIVLGAAVVLAMVGWILPWTWTEQAALGVIVVSVGAAMVWALLQRLPDPVIARALDRSLHTEDAFVSALQFAPTDTFGSAIHDRAASFADADVKTAMPMPWRPKKVAVLGVLLAVLLIALVVRNPQDARREEVAQERERVDELASSLEQEAQALRESNDPSSAALALELASVAQSLREVEDVEAAAVRLDEAQDDLLLTLDADALAQRGAVQGLERALDAQPFPGATTVSEASASTQLASLAGSLEQVSDQERDAVARRLAELASSQSAGDSETAAALNAAAEAIEAGDLAAAAVALESASESAARAAEGADETAAVAAAAADAGRAAADLRDPQPDAAESGESGSGGGEGQGQGVGDEAPSGRPPSNASDEGETGEPTEVGEVELPTDSEVDQVGLDSVSTGDGARGVTIDDQAPNTSAGIDAEPIDLEPFQSVIVERLGDVPDASTNISVTEATTVADYFDQLTEETP